MDRWKGKIKAKKDDEIEMPSTEMCDVCGKDCPMPIPRFSYMSQSGVVYVIRHHPQCDPYIALKRIGLLTGDLQK